MLSLGGFRGGFVAVAGVSRGWTHAWERLIPRVAKVAVAAQLWAAAPRTELECRCKWLTLST